MKNIEQLLNKENWIKYLELADQGGITNHGIAQDIVKEIEEAINYTCCYCTFDSLLERLQELNELKRPYFKWTEQFKKDNRIAWEGKEVELRTLINKLEKELNVL